MRRSAPAFAFVLAGSLAAGCGAGDLRPPPPGGGPPGAAPAFQPLAVPAPIVTEGTVTRIAARADVPLTGPRVDARPGDWLLESAGMAAVVAADGRIVDLGPRGGRDEITALDPTVFLGFDSVHFEIDRIEPVSDGHALHVVRRVLEKPLLLHVFVWLTGDRLHVESAVTPAAALKTPIAVTLGEHVGWGNVPTWAEGHGFVTRGGSFFTEFLAREAYGVAYALCAEGGRLLARFDGPDSGFFEPASTGESPALVPPDAPTPRRAITVAYAAGSIGRAAAALTCNGRPVAQRIAPPVGLPPDAHVDMGRCPEGTRPGSIYTRFHPGEEIALPEGCFQARLGAPGHASTPWFPAGELAQKPLPPSGTLRFAVTDEPTGRPLPARVLVRGVKGTPDPDWGTDADRGAALDVVHAETGAGERPLPPGRYQVVLGRGFEYTAAEREIEVVAGQTVEVRAALARVVDTRGFIAADLHLHAMPSPDAPQPLADRVRALVATGVEVGVATDHNKITDYRPVIAELGMGSYLASVVGDEVTTRDPAYGHFNAFPLPAGAEPLAYRATTPAGIFAAARALGPLGPETIVQVNHPLMGTIGYLQLLRFDREDVAGWARRVPLADLGFDAIEVFNGDHYALIDKVEECLRAWYALLEAGHRVTATGNSDSHRLTFHEAGVPRNLVALPNDDPAAFDERAFVEAVRRGRVVVSSGPFIRFSAGDKGVGDTIPAGDVDLSIVVDAPPWVDVDKVELVRRGEVVATWTAPAPAPVDSAPAPPAKGRKPPKKPEAPAPPPLPVRRFDIHTRQTLTKGDFVLVIARGSKPMSYLHRAGARPFAFTNPIFVE